MNGDRLGQPEKPPLLLGAERTEMGVAAYAEMMGFGSQREFLGAIPEFGKVVDVGAGSGKFGEELAKLKKGIEVISVNPRYVMGFYPNRKPTRGKVASLNPGLSFAANSFDLTLDCWGSVYYAKFNPQLGGVIDFWQDLLRVTKSGGRVLISPIRPEQKVKLLEFLKVEKHQSKLRPWWGSNQIGENLEYEAIEIVKKGGL